MYANVQTAAQATCNGTPSTASLAHSMCGAHSITHGLGQNHQSGTTQCFAGYSTLQYYSLMREQSRTSVYSPHTTIDTILVVQERLHLFDRRADSHVGTVKIDDTVMIYCHFEALSLAIGSDEPYCIMVRHCRIFATSLNFDT